MLVPYVFTVCLGWVTRLGTVLRYTEQVSLRRVQRKRRTPLVVSYRSHLYPDTYKALLMSGETWLVLTNSSASVTWWR